jgi:hypothetical protein
MKVLLIPPNNRLPWEQMKIEFSHIGTFFKSVIIIGILNKGRGEY